MATAIARQDGNGLIDKLSRRDGLRFVGKCESVDLVPGDILSEPDQAFPSAYFPIAGVISVMTMSSHRPPLELGLIGRDGMLGATLSLGVLAAPMRSVVQGAGTALVMAVAQLRIELRNNPRLVQILHRYQFRLTMQLLQTATCTHFHEIEPRLARWLLMIHDLSTSDSVRFTHEDLAHTLGVRRSGVTIAAGALQQRGLISYTRGDISILDRRGLEGAACGCYAGLIEKYRLVFG